MGSVVLSVVTTGMTLKNFPLHPTPSIKNTVLKIKERGNEEQTLCYVSKELGLILDTCHLDCESVCMIKNGTRHNLLLPYNKYIVRQESIKPCSMMCMMRVFHHVIVNTESREVIVHKCSIRETDNESLVLARYRLDSEAKVMIDGRLTELSPKVKYDGAMCCINIIGDIIVSVVYVNIITNVDKEVQPTHTILPIDVIDGETIELYVSVAIITKDTITTTLSIQQGSDHAARLKAIPGSYFRNRLLTFRVRMSEWTNDLKESSVVERIEKPTTIVLSLDGETGEYYVSNIKDVSSDLPPKIASI